MSEAINLEPGSIVAKTGNYKCEMCGPGGMIENISMKAAAKAAGVDSSQFRDLSLPGQGNAVKKFFTAGSTFPDCPNCGPAGGWTLIE